jgi:EAL domain-containing protein (putative c-di-GMP-specific phosphodiesterase class I)
MRTELHAAEHEAVARLGSDLFAVQLSAGDLGLGELGVHSARLQNLLAKPFEVEGHTLFLTACAGSSLFPQQADTAHALLLNAESALHHAKPGGPGSAVVFDSAMNLRVARRLLLHNELHRALDGGEMQLHYQPQVRLKTGELVGFEALLRWKHKTLGWVSPAEFIPVAEESGVIVKIGDWVMRTAALQAAQWLERGHTNFRMAVNLSVRQFVAGNLTEAVQSVLADTGLPAHMLELEVTESLALHSVSTTLSTLHACKSLGVKLAMDDFGTGYSSLSYLKRYPLDALKIDQAFVRNVTRDAGDAAITRAIVAMAHSFGMSVIAEGVETMEQLDFLSSLNCEDFQGYLFSKPVPADEAEKCFGGFTRTQAQLQLNV